VAATTPSAAGEPPLLTSPKAQRVPYSEQAMATPPVQAKPAAATPTKSIATEQPTSTDLIKPEPQKADAPKTDTPNKGEEDSIDWGWPTSGKVIAGFNESTNAKGIDIGGTQGQAINAAGAGRVIYSGSDLRGYGKLVIIKHNKNFLSVYAHNSQILVKEGQQVSKGQKIAEMGNTDADRVKLHFEIRQQGKSIDPAKFLSNN
jgi:lipoprotein NlpD